MEKLHPHEEIIPESLDKLTEKIKNDSLVKHPVIVDKKSLVVLDGMHRVAAIQKLGYRLMLVCSVDYENPAITVGRWFRTVKNGSDETPPEVLKDSNYELESAPLGKIENLMEERKVIAGLLTPKESYTISGEGVENIKKIYDGIREAGIRLKTAGYNVGYETDEDALEKLNSSEISGAVAVPAISKQEIIETALSGEVFPPKSTKHLIPARPLFVNAPIEWHELEPEEANKLLSNHLLKKKVKHLPPGEVFDRCYEEELYIFK